MTKKKRIKMERTDESERCENVWVAVNKGRPAGDVLRAICAWGLTDKSWAAICSHGKAPIVNVNMDLPLH